MAATTTRRQRLEARERAIIEAARAVFLDKGYEKATMQEIAKRAGVAQGSTYLYFKNKEAVLGAVLGDFYARLTASVRQGLRELSTTHTRERFAVLAKQHLEFVMKEWKLILLGVSLQRDQIDYADSDAYRLNREYTTIFDELFADAIARGEIRDDVPSWLVRDQFYGTLEYMARTLMLRGASGRIDEVVDTVMGVLFRGVQTETNPSETKESRVDSLLDRLEGSVARLESVDPGDR